jgi:DNA-directed RNA polymerase specialized sigma24 family protein
MSASIPQVKTWLHRARRQLAQLLTDQVEKPVAQSGEH